MSVYVGGGVPLRVTVLLCLLQRLLEGEARLDHPGKDIVGGAVEDAGDLAELVGCQAGGQGPQDRDAPAHAGLEQIADPVLPGQLEQLIAVGGHQLLIGGDHALARFQRPGGKVQRHRGAADSLHYDVHLGVALDDPKVLDEAVPVRAVREIPHIQDIFQPHQILHPLVDQPAVGGEHLCHAGAHSAKA